MVDLGNDVVLENTGTSWDNNAANGNFEEGFRFLQVVRIRNKTTQTLQEKLRETLKFFTTGFQKSVKNLENVRNSATWIEYVPCKVFLFRKKTWRFRIRTRDSERIFRELRSSPSWTWLSAQHCRINGFLIEGKSSCQNVNSWSLREKETENAKPSHKTTSLNWENLPVRMR